MPRSRLLLPFPWTGTDDPAYLAYMRDEWGVPAHDDRYHFEMLTLQVFQAGLSWAVILKKREAFRKAFAGFDPVRVARFDRRKKDRLARDPGLVRNRPKIEAATGNARAFLRIRKECGSFDAYVWPFVGGRPRKPRRPYRRWEDVPDRSPESEALARDLKARGFRFIGPVSAYAYMQAAGLVNDRVYAKNA